MGKPADSGQRALTLRVWLLRITLGAVFMTSGLAKSIDIWGTVYKIEEYLNLWDLAQPRMIVVTAALLLCGGEFVLGFLLFTGSYRRAAVRLLTVLMGFMLPLSLWIWIADPVADCGCFGDLLHLSNRATFWKNVVITAGLAGLWGANRRVKGGITPYSQWMAGALASLYILIVILTGYNIQPPIDFRRFPPGTQLLADDADSEDSEEEVEYTFIYERDGQRQTFTADNLPDSTWRFVDRVLTSGSEDTRDGFVVLSEGEDITADVVSTDGEELIVTIPEIARVNPSHTYAINTLYRYMTERGGQLVALLAPDKRGEDYWADISMAEYPVFTAEPTLIKELVRGTIGVVFLRNGRVVWKRTLSSIDMDDFEGNGRATALAENEPPTEGFLWKLTAGTLIVLTFIIILDRTGTAIHWAVRRRNKKTASQKNS